MDREVLARVDLDLEVKPPHRRDLRVEPVEERHTRSRMIPRGRAQPRVQACSNRIKHGPDRARLRLDQVDVLGVAPRSIEHELVEGRAAPQRHGPGQRSVREDIDQRPREDEVLLDHGIIGPRGDLSPGHDVGPGDHAIPWSGSTSSLMARRQRRLRGAPVMVWVGSSGAMRGALLATQSASGLAGSARPTSSRR